MLYRTNTSIRFLVSETSRLSQLLSRPNYVGGVIISPPGGCAFVVVAFVESWVGANGASAGVEVF